MEKGSDSGGEAAGRERSGAARRGAAMLVSVAAGAEKTLGRRGRAVEGEDELITDHAACQG